MSSKLKGSRLEAEVDRCRSECDWRRMADVIGWVRSKNSGMEQFGDLLEGELILEAFIESQSEFLTPDPEHLDSLRKAASLLQASLNANSDSSVIVMDARLLLAKLHYITANFLEALANIEKSKLDKAGTPFETLRALKLVAEAYAVKGFSLEHINAKEERRQQQEKNRIQVLYCFEKSAELAISYVTELEKSLNAATRTTATVVASAVNTDKIGELLETTLERVPLLTLRRNACDKRWDAQGVEWYRKIMTSLGDKSLGERLQQRMSRQLAEVLIRGMLESDYEKSSLNNSLSVSQKSQSLGFYTGSHKGYFSPVSRLEEILLLLLISEILSTRDVILSRSDDLQSSRRESIQDATMVHNLLTMVLSNLRQYQLLVNIYERAMKFANQDRYIWYQFALSLMCQGRWLRASRILQQCVALERSDDNECAEHMHLAKIEIEQLGHYDKAVEHAEKAMKLCTQNWLKGRCMLLHAVAFSLKAQTVVTFEERKQMLSDSVDLFGAVISHDNHDELAHFFCGLQYAIARDLDSALSCCQRSLDLNPEQPLAIMFLALIFTARQDFKGARELVIKALHDFPTHYGLLVLRLKLEVKFGRTEEALNSSKHLLDFWRRLPRGSVDVINGNADETRDETLNGTKNGHNDSVKELNGPRVTNREVMGPVAPLFTAPLGIITKASHMSLNASVPDITDTSSIVTSNQANMSEFGGGNSTISDSLGILSSSSSSACLQSTFRIQASIWVELAELFIDCRKVDDIQTCVEEACTLFPNSHQALYVKGRLFSIKAEDLRENDPSSAASCRAHAKSCLLAALAIYPSHIPSLRHLADVYRSDRNLKMAEKILRDVIKVDPLNAESWQMLSEVLSEDQRYEESIECNTTAHSLSSSTPLIPFTEFSYRRDSRAQMIPHEKSAPKSTTQNTPTPNVSSSALPPAKAPHVDTSGPEFSPEFLTSIIPHRVVGRIASKESVVDIGEMIRNIMGAINMKELKENKVATVTDVLKRVGDIEAVLEQAMKQFRSEPSMLTLDPPVNIIGDIHGQFSDLMRIFDECGDPAKTKYLFLGDYVDRGANSLEVIVLVLCLKIKYSNSFFLLRGNHEWSLVNNRYGFKDELERRFDTVVVGSNVVWNVKEDDLKGRLLWYKFNEVFKFMPITALVMRKILCMHGGLSPELRSLDDLRRIQRPADPFDTVLFTDLMWSDPDFDMPNGPSDALYKHSKVRGAGRQFSANAVKSVCDRLGVELVVRAHQVVQDGTEFFAGRRLITVFSAPNYCGQFNNKGGILHVDKAGTTTIKTIAPLVNCTQKTGEIDVDLDFDE